MRVVSRGDGSRPERLASLTRLLARPGFGAGPHSVGAELELGLFGSDGCRCVRSKSLREVVQAVDPRVTLTHIATGVEVETDPAPTMGCPFQVMEHGLDAALCELERVGRSRDLMPCAIGIAPTLSDREVGGTVSSTGVVSLTGRAALLRRVGHSFRVHLRVEPRDYTDVYNAAQLVTPVVLACASNSPLLAGQHLWQETRIALLELPGDASVGFGNRWVRNGAHELFAESAERFPAGRWNRPVFDPEYGGHLRIEMGALPAGPSVVDMAANAAYLIGLTLGIAPRVRRIQATCSFADCWRSFRRAARDGLNAELDDFRAQTPQTRPAAELARALLPVAREGLARAGVDRREASHYLSVIDDRLRANTTGARWQIATLRRLRRESDPSRSMFELYRDKQRSGHPVHHWG